jgi:hypothetical protein
MIDKSNVSTISEDYRIGSSKFILSKIEDELYKEDANVVMPLIRVKHITLPNKGDRWRIFADAEQVIVIEGKKLTKKERTFLRGLDGVSFLIAQIKAGTKSFSGIKSAIKIRLKQTKKKTIQKK